MPDDPYSLGDLARLADVTPRTVRYYVAQGLLPSPEAAGPATRYTEDHLARLRLIKRLQRDHLPLAEIRARLERMGDEDVLAAAAALDPSEPEPSLEAQDTLDFVRSLMRQAGVPSSVPAAKAMPVVGARVPLPAPAPPAAPSAAPIPRRASLLRRIEGPYVASEPRPAPGPAPQVRRAMVREQLPELASEDAAAALVNAVQPPAPSTPRPAAAARLPPDRSTWERLVISADVELHVRRPLDRQTNKRVDQLERIARELFEDP